MVAVVEVGAGSCVVVEVEADGAGSMMEASRDDADGKAGGKAEVGEAAAAASGGSGRL